MFNKLRKAISNKITLIQGSSLKARSSRGVAVLGVGSVVDRVLRLARNMILTRLLAPAEFGLVAIVIAASEIFEAFTEVGVKQSVIHSKRGDEAEYLNVAWWFQAVRGLALFIIGFTVAPWIGSFYNNPNLLPLLRVAFVAVLFNGFISPRVHVLEKKIQFGKWVFLYQGSGLVGILVSLGIALFAVRNVWAIVIGFVTEAVIRCLLSFILCPFVPRISIDRDSLIDILKYARRMLGVAILAVIAFQTDILVLGRVVSAKQVGLYWLSLQLALQISMLFSKVVYPVLLPVFAEKQDDKRSLCNAIKEVTAYTAVFAIPIATFSAACAGSILSAVYGSEYAAVAIPFGLLCIYALVRMQGSSLVQVYFAIGKPHLHRRFVILRLAVLAVLIYPGIVLFGLTGAAAVVLFANCIGLCVQVIWMKKPIGLRFREYASSWIPGLRLAVIVLAPVVLLKVFGNGAVVLNIVVGGLACSAACVIGLLLLRRSRKIYVVSSENTQIG